MASINDISIAINSLFLDISDPLSLRASKNDFLKAHQNLVFHFEERYDLEFSLQPIFRFDDQDSLQSFLKQEQRIAQQHQDSLCPDLAILLKEKPQKLSVEDLFLEYSIDLDGNNPTVIFHTNSMLFRYEAIG